MISRKAYIELNILRNSDAVYQKVLKHDGGNFSSCLLVGYISKKKFSPLAVYLQTALKVKRKKCVYIPKKKKEKIFQENFFMKFLSQA